jgi:serine phosphatase RsbU (regulator of sigma subunit)
VFAATYLGEGDVLALYIDGATEAVNEAGGRRRVWFDHITDDRFGKFLGWCRNALA